MTAKGDFFPRRINDHVPDMQYAADVRFGGVGTILIPAPVAADTDGILDAEDIAVAGSTSTFAAAFVDQSVMSKFGRVVSVVASGAATSDVTIRGKDYLGQPMTETLTLNGTTPVVGSKAFRYIDEVEYEATAATTIDVGWGLGMGVPYRMVKHLAEVIDNVETADAGTFIDGLAPGTTQTATTSDPRGTYWPHSNNPANGVRNFEITALWDINNLHGDAHFFS